MRLAASRLAVLALLFLLTGCTEESTEPATAQDLALEPAFPDLTFDAITDVQSTADGRLFVVEQPGTIQTFDPAADDPQKSVFLDISGRVTDGGERGLLGVAFHPDFAANGRFFVNYTATEGGQLETRIAAFDADAADVPASEQVLLDVDQPFDNHNAGQLQFGPADGLLYVGLGDGGSGGDPQGNGQDRTTLLGAMLRLDVDGNGSAPDCGGPGAGYTIPADNPFVGDASGCDEIFAYGFRNPFRFSFGPDGRLLAGDVGQNAREEIDVVEAGGNYGWNVVEGTQCYPPGSDCDPSAYDGPLLDYGHDATPGGQSVTGGYVFTLDCANCDPVRGRYFYGDFVSGNIWSLAYDAQGTLVDNRLEIASSGLSISTFGRTAEGELLIADRAGAGSTLYRFDRSTLPVELTAFDARADGRAAVLEWRTASEHGNDGFRVERRFAADRRPQAMNGGWTRVAFVESKAEGGVSQQPLRYQLRTKALARGAHGFRLVQVDRGGGAEPVGSVQRVEVRPEGRYDLSVGFPNPFRRATTLRLAVRSAQDVTVAVYDALGRRVDTLFEGRLAPDETHRFRLRGAHLAGGVYFVRVTGEAFAATRAVTLVR